MGRPIGSSQWITGALIGGPGDELPARPYQLWHGGGEDCPADETPVLVAKSSFVALAVALRLFAGKRLGPVVMTACLGPEDSPERGAIVQFALSGRGWLGPLNLLRDAAPRDFARHTDPNARFALPGAEGWVHPPWQSA